MNIGSLDQGFQPWVGIAQLLLFLFIPARFSALIRIPIDSRAEGKNGDWLGPKGTGSATLFGGACPRFCPMYNGRTAGTGTFAARSPDVHRGCGACPLPPAPRRAEYDIRTRINRDAYDSPRRVSGCGFPHGEEGMTLAVRLTAWTSASGRRLINRRRKIAAESRHKTRERLPDSLSTPPRK